MYSMIVSINAISYTVYTKTFLVTLVEFNSWNVTILLMRLDTPMCPGTTYFVNKNSRECYVESIISSSVFQTSLYISQGCLPAKHIMIHHISNQ